MFVIEGPLHPESRLFVGRSAELAQMEAWLTSVRCVGAVLGARQTGKTSLLLKLRHTFQGKYAFVFIDLEGVAGADLDECITYIASEMVSQLGETVARAEIALPTRPNEFLSFLERCARLTQSIRIVVLLDEIGALSPETSLRLTSAIRAVFTSRYVKPQFARYVFVVAGATDALEATTGRNSPLKNVTETLYLQDLSAGETQQLVTAGFDEKSRPPDAGLFQILHDWTNGHPYWTQRLGQAVHEQSADMTEAGVSHAVDQLLHTEDRNLPYIFRALEADPALGALAVALVSGTQIAFARTNGAIARLELIGLVKNVAGRCVIRNRIYREALHRDPVRPVRLPARDLREFGEHLNAAADLEGLLQVATLGLQATLRSRSVVALAVRPYDERLSVVSCVGLTNEAVAGATFDARSRFVTAMMGPSEPAALVMAEDEAACFRQWGIALIVPVSMSGSTKALLCLGKKLAGDDYDSEDREFLSALGEMTARQIDRLRLQMLERDLAKASAIQRNLLPAELPRVAGIQLAASCLPARVVSGDYYDVFKLSERIVALCVGDVVGKGMPAALLMANLQAAVKACSSDRTAPNELCRRVNRLVAQNIRPGEFITFFYALFDIESRRLTYANAGHNPPILIRRQAVERLGEGGPVLGVFPEWSYDQQSTTLEPGDKLLLFTDGVTEARDEADEEFGDDRVIALVRDAANAAALHDSVFDAVKKFSNGILHDDVTVMAICL